MEGPTERLAWLLIVVSTFIGANTFVERAQRAVEHAVNLWYDAWKETIPNFRNPTLAFNVSAASEYTRTFLGLVIDRLIRVRVTGLSVGYERGELVPHSTQVQPAPIEVDPPPFAFKAPETLVLPSGWFKPERAIEVYTDNARQVRLASVVDRGADFERVTFAAA